MANKAISELPQALNVNNQDLFVLEQSGIAKKLTAETFITEQGIIDALAEALDGHGGITSVTLSSVSGRIRTYLITFTDETTTTFQVLDGTSIDRIVKTSTAGLTDTYTVFMTDGTTTFFTVTNGADGTVSEEMLNNALKDKAPAITETTESSAIANFPDGADDLVMHNVVAEINPVQSGSGDPSPSNIRPISGWTGCNVTRTGKNLLDGSIKTQNASYVYFNTTGNRSEKTMTLPAGTYTVSISYTGTVKAHINVYRMSPYERIAVAYSATKLTFTLDKTEDILLWMQNTNFSISDIASIQLEVGSTATAYEEYIEPTTITVDWTSEAGTVYGGTIDVATGLLTVTHGILDLGTKTYTKGNRNTDNTGYIFYFRDATNIASRGDAVCSALKTVTNPANWEALPVNSCNAASGSYMIFCADYADAASFKTAMDGVQLVYTMATSQTYQLSGQQLKTLLGTNNVWADTGNVSVTYPADTKMFIEKLTQPTEDDMTANQAITSGKFFMVGNNLYIATAAIASGAKIIEGTNATRLSLADALNRL
jgi:hypothetical protein